MVGFDGIYSSQEEYAQQLIDEYRDAGEPPRQLWPQSFDTYELLDVLARDVGILGIFSDWPATVTYYDNCMSHRRGRR